MQSLGNGRVSTLQSLLSGKKEVVGGGDLADLVQASRSEMKCVSRSPELSADWSLFRDTPPRFNLDNKGFTVDRPSEDFRRRESTSPRRGLVGVVGSKSAPDGSWPRFSRDLKENRDTGCQVHGSLGRRVFSETHRPPTAWVGGQSALVTVLTRDLYPTSEWICPPPSDVDLKKYYADFLPKNLSDCTCEKNSSASSIPSFLGRSASMESLHKDRLLPLFDKLIDEDLEFSSRKIFKNPESKVYVGFFLDGSTSQEKDIDSSSDVPKIVSEWIPYFGDKKDSIAQPLATLPNGFDKSLHSQSASSGRKPSRSSSSSAIKRSHSAEPSKKDKRSECAKRMLRVRFADTEGHDISTRKQFLKSDEIRIPSRALEALRSGIERDRRDIGARFFIPLNFNTEARSEAVKNRLLEERKVVLDKFHITPDLILGTAEVANLSSDDQKKVFIRCTYNDWNSFDDVPAGRVSSSSSSSSYNFTLNVPRHFVKGDVFEFAVCYSAMGRIYWDNNDGVNYVVECYARQCPLHDADRTWISFL